MATINVTKRSVAYRLDIGVKPDGSIKLATVNLPKLDLTAKEQAIANAVDTMQPIIAPVFEHSVHDIRMTTTATILGV